MTDITYVVRKGALEGRLPVRELARSCVGACALAAAELGARRAGLAKVPGIRVDDGAVATAFVSERHLLVDGRAPVTFAPLSRFWRTADGWVRTHANYPHHRARLLAALGVREDERAVTAVEAALAERSALEAEEAVYAAGGLAVALRTPEEWAAHEQGAAVAGRPLVERERLDSARARALPPIDTTPSAPASTSALLPAAGLRVLDLTRVIAGPVATRTLALLGAEVLRVDAPRLPELPDQHADTGFGKRSTTLDLVADRRAFEELLAAADVVVTGYRPGALDRFGLSAQALAERRPGVVVAQLSAWGGYGPWGGRRGFDSLVQVATGIAAVEGSVEEPGARRRRPWTTGRDTCWRRPCCGRWPSSRTRAAVGSCGWRWPGRPGGSWTGSGRAAPRVSRTPGATRAASKVRRTTGPAPGWRRRTVGSGGCGTPCRRSSSRAARWTGRGRRGRGERTRRAGAESRSGRKRTDGRNAAPPVVSLYLPGSVTAGEDLEVTLIRPTPGCPTRAARYGVPAPAGPSPSCSWRCWPR